MSPVVPGGLANPERTWWVSGSLLGLEAQNRNPSSPVNTLADLFLFTLIPSLPGDHSLGPQLKPVCIEGSGLS